jgi:Sulfotransferase family
MARREEHPEWFRGCFRQLAEKRCVRQGVDTRQLAAMISLQKRFLFVHIPKTAGNSIQSALRDYSEDELVVLRKEQDGIERFGLRNPMFNIKKHSTLAEYRDALGDQQFRQLYKFTCVRNPWDRMVSYYFTPTQNPEIWNRKKFRGIISKAVSVADYLRLNRGEKDPFENVEYIMRFENLDDDFRAVCASLRIPASSLPHYNRSNSEHYSKYYDVELRELVRERFAAEIERFGYAFEAE